MTNEEKQEIINEVLAALHTHGKTIDQLTPVTSPSDSDAFELSGGRNLSYGKLKELITAIFTAILEGYIPADALWEYIEQYIAKLDTNGALNWQESPVVMLATMGTTYDNVDGELPAYTLQEGDMFYWNHSDFQIFKKLSDHEEGLPAKTGVVYFNMRTMRLYKWTGSTMVCIAKVSSVADIVNNLVEGGGDKALSAEMGKRLKEKVEEVQANIQRLYNNLGNIAFWDAAAKSAAAPIPLDWGGTKHLVTLNLSLTNAVVKHNGTAVADGATIQVEEYDTLTLLVEASSGYALQSVTSSTTGAVVTDNGNGTYNVALTIGQSNVTLAITATAAQAFTISYGTMTNCSVVQGAPTSILSGQSVEIEFSAESGYELDSSCFAVANADKSWSASTNKLTISNATGNVTISATAEVPKLKFLKYYWMNYNGTNPYPSKGNSQGFYGKFAVSDFIQVPQMTITSSTKWKLYYNWAAMDSTVRPLIMSYYNLENGQYTYLANKTAQNNNVKEREWTMSDSALISACAAGTLYVRLTLGMNTSDGTGTALASGGYATVGGTDIFRVGADNYRLVDEQDWDVDDLNL